jgi:signal transduction histidine kinase
LKSLQGRLNRGLALILIVIFAFHWLLADWVIRFVAETQMETRLEHDGDSLFANLTIAANDKLTLNTQSVGLIYGQPNSGHYFALQFDGQRRDSISLSGFKLEIPELKPGNQRHYHTQGPNNQPLLALQRAFAMQGQVVNLIVAEDLTDITRKILLFRAIYLMCTLVVLLMAIFLQSRDVRRSLRPLNDARKQLEAVSKGKKPQIETCPFIEIEPLTKEINRLLVLVERRLLMSRTAIGNLAHALKTPLAILYRMPDNPLLATHPELQGDLREQTAAIQDRIERELKRARLSGNIHAGNTFNPHLELVALTGLLHKIYADKQLSIEFSAPDQLFSYDRQDMLELLGNLADNACKWAVNKIRIEITAGNNTLAIMVADDGPGVPDEQMKDLTQRGLRLDEAQPGHGLGLAIVQDIVALYGGQMALGKSRDLGGLEIAVHIKF